jgi:hypothetical protein
MTPERIAGLVARWVRFYTRKLPAGVAERRIEEIDADVHDQIAHGRAGGVGDRRIALGIASRMVRGLAADVSWRGRYGWGVSRSGLRVALGVAFVLSLPLVAMLFTDGVVWSLADFVVAGILLTALAVALELAVKRAGGLATAVGIAVLGVASAIVGNADDAPGLVLLGILLVVTAGVLGVRAGRPRARDQR